VSGDWTGLVVFFGGTAWDGNRFPDQHMAERLARYAPVLYVDPPLTAVRALRGGGLPALRPQVVRLGESLLRLTPVVPPRPQRRGVRALTAAVTRAQVRHVLAELDTQADVLVVAGLAPALDIVPARLRVLYGTDDFVAGAELMDVSRTWLTGLEGGQLRAADVVVAVSDELAGRWRPQCGSVTVIENGCDVDLFARADDVPPPDDVRLPRPVAGFVGHLSDRIDLDLLEAVAATGHSLLLVGPRQSTFAVSRVASLLDRPNVQWVGPKAFEQLPAYVGQMDVGLVPYADTAFNRASFPLKTLEYLAAGRACVVTDLPAMRRLGDAVEVASTPVSYAQAVSRALTAGPDPSAAARRRTVAAGHTWDARAAELAELLGLADGRRSVA
jgi:teichuronic acid biosynthesis glycosyltransferase TuaH